jgi:MFS family permease
VRIGLIVIGVAMLAIGGVVLLTDVSPRRHLGIAAWMLGALVVHDAVIAPVVLFVGALLRRAGRRIPGAVLVIVQVALVVGAVVTALVVPEILKQGIGTENPTVLPLEYGLNLAVFYAGLAVATAAAIVGYLVASRAKTRPSRAQS